MPTIYIPTPMRTFSNGKAQIKLPMAHGTIRELLSSLGEMFPGIEGQIFDEAGAIKLHLNIFVNSRQIPRRDGVGATIEDKDEVLIIAAMAGG